MKKLGTLILGAILTIGIGAGISVKPATDVAKAGTEVLAYTLNGVGNKQSSKTNYNTSHNKSTKIFYTRKQAKNSVLPLPPLTGDSVTPTQ